MTYRLITCLTIFVASLCASSSIAAQFRIDNIVSRLEKDPKVTVTYTEKREPKSHKLEKQSTILGGNSKKDAEALWKAFDAERNHSVSVTKTRDQSFIIKFITNDIMSTYILTVNGTSWSLVINKRPAEEDEMSWTGFDFESLNGLEALNSLDALAGLDALNSLDALDGLYILNDLDSNISTNANVRIYDSSGKLIFENKGKSDSDNKDKGKDKTQAKAKAMAKELSKSSAISTAKKVTNVRTKSRPARKTKSRSKSISTTTTVSGGSRTVTVIDSDGRTHTTVSRI